MTAPKPIRSVPTLAMIAGAVLCAWAAGAQPAPSAEPATRLILDAELRPRRVQVTAITPQAVAVRDETGRASAVPAGDVLAILPTLEGPAEVRAPRAEADPRGLGRLDLVGGQVFPGRLAPDAAPAETLLWESASWGRLTIRLEDAAAVRFTNAGFAFPRAASAGDRVFLNNGDVAEGFVAEVGPVVRLDRGAEGSRSRVTAPVESVAAIAFANPARPPEGTYLWLFNGAVARVHDVTLSASGELVAQPAVCATPVPPLAERDLRAVLFDARRLKGLALIPSGQVAAGPGTGRRWAPPPVISDPTDAPLFAADIELPGPMSVEWELPRGAVRFAGSAELPVSARVWGDLHLVIGIADGPPLWSQRLHADQPVGEFNIEIPASKASRLRITIEPGPNGPVQDRVVLRRPMLLVEPPPEGR